MLRKAGKVSEGELLVYAFDNEIPLGLKERYEIVTGEYEARWMARVGMHPVETIFGDDQKRYTIFKSDKYVKALRID